MGPVLTRVQATQRMHELMQEGRPAVAVVGEPLKLMSYLHMAEEVEQILTTLDGDVFTSTVGIGKGPFLAQKK